MIPKNRQRFLTVAEVVTHDYKYLLMLFLSVGLFQYIYSIFAMPSFFNVEISLEIVIDFLIFIFFAKKCNEKHIPNIFFALSFLIACLSDSLYLMSPYEHVFQYKQAVQNAYLYPFIGFLFFGFVGMIAVWIQNIKRLVDFMSLNLLFMIILYSLSFFYFALWPINFNSQAFGFNLAQTLLEVSIIMIALPIFLSNRNSCYELISLGYMGICSVDLIIRFAARNHLGEDWMNLDLYWIIFLLFSLISTFSNRQHNFLVSGSLIVFYTKRVSVILLLPLFLLTVITVSNEVRYACLFVFVLIVLGTKGIIDYLYSDIIKLRDQLRNKVGLGQATLAEDHRIAELNEIVNDFNTLSQGIRRLHYKDKATLNRISMFYHHIKTPLMIMQNNIDHDAAELLSAVRMVEDTAKAVVELYKNNSFDVSAPHLRPLSIIINDTLKEVRASQPDMNKNSFEFYLDSELSCCTADFDISGFKMVITSLIQNSFTYSPNNNRGIKLECELDDDKRLSIILRNNRSTSIKGMNSSLDDFGSGAGLKQAARFTHECNGAIEVGLDNNMFVVDLKFNVIHQSTYLFNLDVLSTKQVQYLTKSSRMNDIDRKLLRDLNVSIFQSRAKFENAIQNKKNCAYILDQSSLKNFHIQAPDIIESLGIAYNAIIILNADEISEDLVSLANYSRFNLYFREFFN